jgi:hypothetical protein
LELHAVILKANLHLLPKYIARGRLKKAVSLPAWAIDLKTVEFLPNITSKEEKLCS